MRSLGIFFPGRTSGCIFFCANDRESVCIPSGDNETDCAFLTTRAVLFLTRSGSGREEVRLSICGMTLGFSTAIISLLFYYKFSIFNTDYSLTALLQGFHSERRV